MREWRTYGSSINISKVSIAPAILASTHSFKVAGLTCVYLSILSPGQGWYRSAKAQNSTKAPLTGNPNQLGPHMLRGRAPPTPHLPRQLAPVLEQYLYFKVYGGPQKSVKQVVSPPSVATGASAV
jgi:hypothetical protein